jgi:hypothetical protein
MFYVRSIMEQRKAGARAPDGEAFGLMPLVISPRPGGDGGLRAKSEKRIDTVEPAPLRRRGGQPGNGNALKTGRYTGQARGARKQIRGFLRGVKATLARVEADLAAQRKGRQP